MIFIKIDNDNVVTFRHFMPFDSQYGLGKSEDELLQEGIFVNTIPSPDTSDQTKVPVLKYDGEKLYYEYEDAPVDEMTALKNKVELQEKALAELTMYISTLGV